MSTIAILFRLLVNCALPYANGPLHLGHIAGAYLGGGRYDDLSKLFTTDRIPAVGFAIGDAVIELLLKRQNLWMKRNIKKSG